MRGLAVARRERPGRRAVRVGAGPDRIDPGRGRRADRQLLLPGSLRASKFSQREYLSVALLLLPAAVAAVEGRHDGLAVMSVSTVSVVDAPPDADVGRHPVLRGGPPAGAVAAVAVAQPAAAVHPRPERAGRRPQGVRLPAGPPGQADHRRRARPAAGVRRRRAGPDRDRRRDAGRRQLRVGADRRRPADAGDADDAVRAQAVAPVRLRLGRGVDGPHAARARAGGDEGPGGAAAAG